jgi:hypothetical protein
MDQFDNLDSIGPSRQSQTQILDYHLVISFLDESFRFLDLARSIDLETMLGEILTHGKTDRLFVINDKQLCRAWFAIGNFNCRLFPATEELPEAAGYGFECQH